MSAEADPTAGERAHPTCVASGPHYFPDQCQGEPMWVNAPATPDAGDASEAEAPHEFVGSTGVCHACGRWDLNGIHETAPDAGDASTSANEAPSEDEREALWNVIVAWTSEQATAAETVAFGRVVAAREAAAATKRVEDAAQTIALMPAEHRPRSVVASIFTGHTLGCTCEVCAFMGEEPSAAAKAAGERALLDVADEWLSEYDGEASHVAHFLRARAARIAREVTP